MEGLCTLFSTKVLLCEYGWLTSGGRCVGTEEGILEYTVNLQERKTFPGLSFR